jgi:hypothetical protein
MRAPTRLREAPSQQHGQSHTRAGTRARARARTPARARARAKTRRGCDEPGRRHGDTGSVAAARRHARARTLPETAGARLHGRAEPQEPPVDELNASRRGRSCAPTPARPRARRYGDPFVVRGPQHLELRHRHGGHPGGAALAAPRWPRRARGGGARARAAQHASLLPAPRRLYFCARWFRSASPVTCDPPFELLHGEAVPSATRESRSSVPVRSRAAPVLAQSPPTPRPPAQNPPHLDLAAERRRLTRARIAGRRRAAHIRPWPPAPLRRLENALSRVCAPLGSPVPGAGPASWPVVGRRRQGAVLQNRSRELSALSALAGAGLRLRGAHKKPSFPPFVSAQLGADRSPARAYARTLA